MMELQLGLALPVTYSVTKGLDLNSYQVCDSTEEVVVGGSVQVIGKPLLQLVDRYTFPLFDSAGSNSSTNRDDSHRKRGFVDAFQDIEDVPPTLPLLLWDKQPNDEEDGPSDVKANPFVLNKANNGERNGIVGWPPIKLRRKKLPHQRRVENGCVHCQKRPTNSKYVKVTAEGVAIGRKIDLSIYYSLHTLKLALLAMFGIPQKKSRGYKLTYQDMEGNWLYADSAVSWRGFIGSVQRLKLVRTEEWSNK